MKGNPSPVDAGLQTMPTGDFIRMSDMRRMYGISRAKAYELANNGLIKTISLRATGNIRGVRLISKPSVDAYLNQLLRQQNK
jgi:hypothetical protein